MITHGQHAVGLMTLHRIKEVPRREWATTSAAAVMLFLEQSKRTNPDTELWTALQQMDRDGVNQLPVTRDNQVIGMLSTEDVVYLPTHRNSEHNRRNSGRPLNGDEMKRAIPIRALFLAIGGIPLTQWMGPLDTLIGS